MLWVAGIQQDKLLNMLYIPHIGRRNINTIYVWKLFTLVYDECLWLGIKIPIDHSLFRRINVLPYQGANPHNAFAAKY